MTSIAETPCVATAADTQPTPSSATPPTDVQVWQALRDGLHRCLKLDGEIAAHCGTAHADNACEAFDREVDGVLEAYSDLVNRGLIGLFEDVLVERGMCGDCDDDCADDRGFDAGDVS